MAGERTPTAVDEDEIRTNAVLNPEDVKFYNVGRVQIADVVLRARDRKVRAEARYDSTDDTIDVRRTYYLEGEQVNDPEWTQVATVEKEDDTVTDADGVVSGDALDDAVEKYLRSRLMGAAAEELGPVFDDVLARA